MLRALHLLPVERGKEVYVAYVMLCIVRIERSSHDIGSYHVADNQGELALEENSLQKLVGLVIQVEVTVNVSREVMVGAESFPAIQKCL